MSTPPPQPTRRTWAWVLVILGPLLAIGGVAAPVIVMAASFHAVANAPSTPSPSALASDIATGRLVAIVGIPAALLGVSMTIAGIVLLLVRPKPPGE